MLWFGDPQKSTRIGNERPNETSHHECLSSRSHDRVEKLEKLGRPDLAPFRPLEKVGGNWDSGASPVAT